MWKPEVGEEVAACYDGKSGRATAGTVIEAAEDSIRVKFKRWDDPEQVLEHVFPRHNEICFGDYVPVEESLMEMMVGSCGDWYSIFRLSDMPSNLTIIT